MVTTAVKINITVIKLLLYDKDFLTYIISLNPHLTDEESETYRSWNPGLCPETLNSSDWPSWPSGLKRIHTELLLWEHFSLAKSKSFKGTHKQEEPGEHIK